ncbi:MAG: TRAP transporter small permease [Desulfobacterales bacterium]|nr:TRAP transporter small permease [Desulfobacterales bacterium]
MIFEWITSGILISLLLIVWAQVASRYLFNNSLSWTEEASRYLMIWGVLLGMNLAYLKGYLISIDFFTKKLPAKIQIPLGIFRKILSLIFTGILTYYGVHLCVLGTGMESPAIGINYLWVFLSVPIGSGVLFILFLVNPIKK